MEEGMVKDLVDCGTFRWVKYKDLRDEVLSLIRYRNVVRERIIDGPDAFVGLLDFLSFERWLADDHRVHDDSKRPDINLEAVPLFRLKDLGSDIVGCAAYSPPLLVLEVELGSEAEVATFDLHLIV